MGSNAVDVTSVEPGSKEGLPLCDLAAQQLADAWVQRNWPYGRPSALQLAGVLVQAGLTSVKQVASAGVTGLAHLGATSDHVQWVVNDAIQSTRTAAAGGQRCTPAPTPQSDTRDLRAFNGTAANANFDQGTGATAATRNDPRDGSVTPAMSVSPAMSVRSVTSSLFGLDLIDGDCNLSAASWEDKGSPPHDASPTGISDWLHRVAGLDKDRAVAAAGLLRQRLGNPGAPLTLKRLRNIASPGLLRGACMGLDDRAITMIVRKLQEERDLDAYARSPYTTPTPVVPPTTAASIGTPRISYGDTGAGAGAVSAGAGTVAYAGNGTTQTVTVTPASAHFPGATLPSGARSAASFTRGGASGREPGAMVAVVPRQLALRGSVPYRFHKRERRGALLGALDMLLAEARDQLRATLPTNGSNELRFRFVNALNYEPIPVALEASTTVEHAGGMLMLQEYQKKHRQFFPHVCPCCALLGNSVEQAHIPYNVDVVTSGTNKPRGRPVPRKIQLVCDNMGQLVFVAKGRENDRIRLCNSHGRNPSKPSPSEKNRHSVCMWHVVAVETRMTLQLQCHATTVIVGVHANATTCPCGRSEAEGCEAARMWRNAARLRPMGVFAATHEVPPLTSPRGGPTEQPVSTPPLIALDPPVVEGPPAAEAAPAVEVDTYPGLVRIVHYPDGMHVLCGDRLQTLRQLGHPIRANALAAPHDRWLLMVEGWFGRHTQLPILIRTSEGSETTLVGAQLEPFLPGLKSRPGMRHKAVLQHIAASDFGIMPVDRFRATFDIVHVRWDELSHDEYTRARSEVESLFGRRLSDHVHTLKRHQDDDRDDHDSQGGRRSRRQRLGSFCSGGSHGTNSSSDASGSSAGAGAGSSGGGGGGGGGSNGTRHASAPDGHDTSPSPGGHDDGEAEREFIVWLAFLHHLADGQRTPLACVSSGPQCGNYCAVHVAAALGPTALAFALEVCQLDPQQRCDDGTAADVAAKFGPSACVHMLDGVIDERTSEGDRAPSTVTVDGVPLSPPSDPRKPGTLAINFDTVAIQGGDDSQGSYPRWDMNDILRQVTQPVRVWWPATQRQHEAEPAPGPGECTLGVVAESSTDLSPEPDALAQQPLEARAVAPTQQRLQGCYAATPPPVRKSLPPAIQFGADVIQSPCVDPHQHRRNSLDGNASTASSYGAAESKGSNTPEPCTASGRACTCARVAAAPAPRAESPDVRQRATVGRGTGAFAPSAAVAQSLAQHQAHVSLIEMLFNSAKENPAFAAQVASELRANKLLSLPSLPAKPSASALPAKPSPSNAVATQSERKPGNRPRLQFCHGCSSQVPVTHPSGEHEVLPGASAPLCGRCCTLIQCVEDMGFDPSKDQHDDRLRNILKLVKLNPSATTREALGRPRHLMWSLAARHAKVCLVRVDRRTGRPIAPRIELPEYRNETKRITVVPPGTYMVEMSAIPRAGDWVDLALGVGLHTPIPNSDKYKLWKLPLQNRPGAGDTLDAGDRPRRRTECIVDQYRVCARDETVSVMPQFGPVDLEAGNYCRLTALACLAHEIIKDHEDDLSDLDQQHWLAFKIFCYRDQTATSTPVGPTAADRGSVRGSCSECSRSVGLYSSEDAEPDRATSPLWVFAHQPGLKPMRSPRTFCNGRTTPDKTHQQSPAVAIQVDNGSQDPSSCPPRELFAPDPVSASTVPPAKFPRATSDPPVVAGAADDVPGAGYQYGHMCMGKPGDVGCPVARPHPRSAPIF